MLYHRQLDLFQFLGDVSLLIQEASSVLTDWRGVGRVLISVWECPDRIVKDLSGQQSFDLRSWPSSVVPFVYEQVVLCFHCTNLCIPGCFE